MTEPHYHRAFGVYGILHEQNQLLVINKTRGPYINRYDLPGGSLEEGESLTDAMKREFLEETGLQIEIDDGIGTIDFKLPWLWKEYTNLHHIAVYYSVRRIRGELKIPEQFEGQDSLGATWISEQDASIENASPLVLKAFQWLRTNNLGLDSEVYDSWKIVK
ncbi:NUDIX hydrolase [Rossellomorea aquimaris]|uniref:NUDIX hydrolase n=1 Tax=Rossellomorea aquimaris TaxID=189382 RepID=UPI001CD7FDE5|nr:NUDIX hydrolase [Rossellomorea aquimaris]MCA1054027.1 NUDIX hydrolase [Rossellomorea aquimaris]